MSFHLISPILYMFFVRIIQLVQPCPQSKLMKRFRCIHNILLYALSFLLLLMITFGTYSTGKFNSINNLLCLSYNNNLIVNRSVYIFLYSKYLEWLDTVFLHLSGKHISMLQYTHHMTTVVTVYINQVDYVSPYFIIPMGLNCLVHVPMYWYFAFPKGFLYKYREWITRSQIIQHILVIISGIYTLIVDNCEQNKYGNKIGLLLYFMYLFYFTVFYISSYLKRD